MFKSLRFRMILIVGISTSLLFLLEAIAILCFFEISLWSEFDSVLRDRAHSLGQLIEQEENGFSFEWLEGVGLPAPIREDSEALAVWFDEECLEVLPPRTPPLRVPSELDPFSIRNDVFDTRLNTGRNARAIVFRFAPRIVFNADENQLRQLQQPRVSLVYARSTSEMTAVISTLRWTIILVGFFGTALTLGLSWIAVGIGLTPVDRAAYRISEIRAGTLDQRLDNVETLPLELQPLANTINQLLHRLEQAFERERSFSADVAHELRTPLAGLRAQLELAQSRPRTSSEYLRTISTCLEITSQTTAIVEVLLATTKSAVIRETKQWIRIRDLMTIVLTETETLSQARQLTIVIAVPETLEVRSDRHSLLIILRNLIRNAVSHCDFNSEIKIEASESDIGCEIVISNFASSFQGPDIEKVFQRFWRADSSRHDTGSQCGLGLTLCQKIASMTGCELRAHFADGVFRMELLLPNCAN